MSVVGGMMPMMLPCWFTLCCCVDGDGGDGGDGDGVVDVCV